MRLPADKVKEAILHADQDVREAAVYYFARSHSSDPTIMPLVIQAIEKFGFDYAFQAHSFMEDLVQTDETVHWLIQQLTKLGQPANEKEAGPILAYISALIRPEIESIEVVEMVLELLVRQRCAIPQPIVLDDELLGIEFGISPGLAAFVDALVAVIQAASAFANPGCKRIAFDLLAFLLDFGLVLGLG
jgi:hypothetical protein